MSSSPLDTYPSPLYFLGIDVGTSGIRTIVIDTNSEIIAEVKTALPSPLRENDAIEQDPNLWWSALQEILIEVGKRVDTSKIQSLCLDGTSGTVLLCDDAGQPISPGLMYNDARAKEYLESIAQQAPADSAVHSATSGLAKLLWLMDQPFARYTKYFCHQADWLNGQLTGQYDISDINNCLKSGYDPLSQSWPDWLESLGVDRHWLPKVVSPGDVIGTLDPDVAAQLGLSPHTMVLAGTTDSTAAFIATGASQPGEAVTSLGSTLVLKIIAEQPVFDREHGVYSQPLGDYWLVGGGSNSGGAVLRHFFSDSQMQSMQQELNIETPTGLDYYPLLQPGERFPYNDPHWLPKMTPRPSDDTVFFQGLLEGLTTIEHKGYRLLEQLGAPYPGTIYTVGGGSVNQPWMQMRKQKLDVSIVIPQHTEAAYGMARLAQQGYEAQHD